MQRLFAAFDISAELPGHVGNVRVGITPIQVHPGSHCENGYNERFNGTLRREILNAELLSTTRQPQIVINQWLRQYNHIRPHHALGMRPPVPETILMNHQITGTDRGSWARTAFYLSGQLTYPFEMF